LFFGNRCHDLFSFCGNHRAVTTWITPVPKESKPNLTGARKGDGKAMTPGEGGQWG
jgi:hypothetical protein